MVEYSATYGILYSSNSASDKPITLSITDSVLDTVLSDTAELRIQSFATGIGVLTKGTPVHLDFQNATMTVHADNGKAYGVQQLDTVKDVRINLLQPTSISISGANPDNFFNNIDPEKVRNTSVPLSQCHFERGQSRYC